MTGTPILNLPVDLYSIFHLIDPIRFPSGHGSSVSSLTRTTA